MLAEQPPDAGGVLRRHDVEHAGRNAGLPGKLGDCERRQRRFLRGFDDHGAARGECRRRLAGDHRQREVPERDGGADADRLFQHDETPVATGRPDDVAIDALGFFREPIDEGV